MKKLLPYLIIAILFSCTQNNEIKNEETTIITSKATIMGFDIRQCECCGGYMIKIENENYRALSLPENNLNIEQNFPIEVVIDWELVVDDHENLAGQIGNCTDIIDVSSISLN